MQYNEYENKNLSDRKRPVKSNKNKQISAAAKSSKRCHRPKHTRKWDAERFNKENAQDIHDMSSAEATLAPVHVPALIELQKRWLAGSKLHAKDISLDQYILDLEIDFERKGFSTYLVEKISHANVVCLMGVYLCGWGLPHINELIRDPACYWYKKYSNNNITTGIGFRRISMQIALLTTSSVYLKELFKKMLKFKLQTPSTKEQKMAEVWSQADSHVVYTHDGPEFDSDGKLVRSSAAAYPRGCIYEDHEKKESYWSSITTKIKKFLRRVAAKFTGTVASLFGFISEKISFVWNQLITYLDAFSYDTKVVRIMAAIILFCVAAKIFKIVLWPYITAAVYKLMGLNSEPPPPIQEEKIELDDELTVDENEVLGDIKTVDSQGLLGTVGGLLVGMTQSSAFVSIEEFLTHFGNVVSRTTTIANTASTIFFKLVDIFEWFYFKATGHYLTDIKKANHEAKQLIASVGVLRTQILVKKTLENTNEFIEKYERLRHLIVNLRLGSFDPQLANLVSQTMLINLSLFDACYSFARSHQIRPEPVGVHLVGKPGVGKTTIKDILIRYLTKNVYKKDPSSEYVFDRKQENEFWEGYNSQFFTVIDDIFQVVDVENRRKQALEYIYMINRNPYQLHMAEMSSKTGTYFNSDFVITTSNYHNNTYLPTNLGITDYQAVYRRMHCKFLVQLQQGKVIDKNAGPASWKMVESAVEFVVLNDDNSLGGVYDLKGFCDYVLSFYSRRKGQNNGDDSLLDPPGPNDPNDPPNDPNDPPNNLDDDDDVLPINFAAEPPAPVKKEKDIIPTILPIDDGAGVFPKKKPPKPANKPKELWAPKEKVVESKIKLDVVDEVPLPKIEVKDVPKDPKPIAEKQPIPFIVDADAPKPLSKVDENSPWEEQADAIIQESIANCKSQLAKIPEIIMSPEEFEVKSKQIAQIMLDASKAPASDILSPKTDMMDKAEKVKQQVTAVVESKNIQVTGKCKVLDQDEITVLETWISFKVHEMERPKYISNKLLNGKPCARRDEAIEKLITQHPDEEVDILNYFTWHDRTDLHPNYFRALTFRSAIDNSEITEADYERCYEVASNIDRFSIPLNEVKGPGIAALCKKFGVEHAVFIQYMCREEGYQDTQSDDDFDVDEVEAQSGNDPIVDIKEEESSVLDNAKEIFTNVFNRNTDKKQKKIEMEVAAKQLKPIPPPQPVQKVAIVSDNFIGAKMKDCPTCVDKGFKTTIVRCAVCDAYVCNKCHSSVTAVEHFEVLWPGFTNECGVVDKMGFYSQWHGTTVNMINKNWKTQYLRVDLLLDAVACAEKKGQSLPLIKTFLSFCAVHRLRLSQTEVRLYYTCPRPDFVKVVVASVDDMLYNFNNLKVFLTSYTPWYYSTYWGYYVAENDEIPDVMNRQCVTYRSILFTTAISDSIKMILVILGVLGVTVLTAAVLVTLLKSATAGAMSTMSMLFTNSQSIDPKTERRQRRQMRKKNPERKPLQRTGISVPKPTEAQVAQHTSQASTRMFNNIHQIKIHYDDGSTMTQFVVFVEGTTCFTAAHALKWNSVYCIELLWCKGKDDGALQIKPIDYTLRYFDDRDLARITFNHLPPFRKITNLLPKRGEYQVNGLPIRCDFTDEGTDILITGTKVTVTNEPLKSRLKTPNGSEHITILRDTYTIHGVAGMGGDCGLPYFLDNIKLPPRILGIHVAGTGPFSYVAPIWYEDCLNLEEPSMGDVQNVLSQCKLLDETPPVIPGMKSIARLDTHYHMSTDSDLAPTPLQDGFFLDGKLIECPYQIRKVPTKMKPFYKEGQRVEPLKKAFTRLEGRKAPPFPHLEDYEFDELMEGVVHKNFDWTQVRALTMDEVINGVPGTDIKGITIDSSPGVGFRERGMTTDDMFPLIEGTVKRTIHPEVQKMVDAKVEMMERGEVPPYVTLLSLKSELKEKGKEDKPRLFSNGEKTHLLLCKMFMAWFFSLVCAHSGDGDVYIGINPFSSAWTFLENKFHAINTDVMCDDTEAWDYNYRYAFVCQFLKWFRRHFMANTADQQRFVKFFTLLMMSLFCPYVIIDDCLYQLVCMPSGCFATAMMNSIYNSFMSRFCCKICIPHLRFNEYGACATFGDDLMLAVLKEFMQHCNGIILAALCKKYFGINKTPISKKIGAGVQESYPLITYNWDSERAQFLQRQFSVQEDGTYARPILNPASIEGMLLWYRPNKQIPKEELIIQNFETAMRELAYYPGKRMELTYRMLLPYVRSLKPNYSLPFTKGDVVKSILN